MYTTTITATPIFYGCNIPYAVNAFNAIKNTKLSELDARILNVLSTAPRGMTAQKCREAASVDGKNIFSVTFNRAVNRLISLHYMQRTKHSKWVYYTITTKGRNALAQLNDHLIQIVNDKLAALNK